MGDILDFPSRVKQLNDLFDKAVSRAAGGDPVCEQKYRTIVEELRVYLISIYEKTPTFSFTAAAGSTMAENEEQLGLAVSELREKFFAIQTDLVSTIIALKIESIA